jgi:Tfp pilus assembly protein PilF
MSSYAEGAKLDPLNAALRIRLAGEYAAIGDSASARRNFGDASRAAPADAAVHHAFGVYLQSQHDYRAAIHEFQLFVDLAPGNYPAATIDAVQTHITRLAEFSAR